MSTDSTLLILLGLRLRFLRDDPTVTVAAIGRQLGVSRQTVHAHIRRLRAFDAEVDEAPPVLREQRALTLQEMLDRANRAIEVLADEMESLRDLPVGHQRATAMARCADGLGRLLQSVARVGWLDR